MCGISGIVSRTPSFPIEKTIREMNKAIAHRGPDDEGLLFCSSDFARAVSTENSSPEVRAMDLPWSPQSSFEDNAFLAFGHRRLSILDLHATGHQPLCDVSKRYWITYNGELYNHAVLRKELENAGHRFFGSSDTEVLLHAYIEWGAECLSRFDGMWAFAIYDTLSQSLFAARDRAGVKPFYFHHSDSLFAFSSEIKGLLKIPGFQTRINQEAAYQYLVLGISEQNEQSLFEGVLELLPGEMLEFNCRSFELKKKRYYHISTNKSRRSFSKQELQQNCDEIYSLLQSSVLARSTADVPVGACLSGGLDSSAIVALMLKHANTEFPLHLFTSVFPDSSRDESKWASLLAKHPRAVWLQDIPNADDFAHDFSTLIYAQDLPFYSMTAFTHFHLMAKVQKSGIKVVLDGQGADELLGGYQLHYSLYLRDALQARELKSISILSSKGHSGFSSKKEALRFIAKTKTFSNLPDFFYKRYKSGNFENQYYSDTFWKSHQNLFNEHYRHYQKDLNSFLEYQFFGCELKTLLRVGDRNSMHHSVESRTPFSDSSELIEKVFSIPANQKINLNTSKYLLREAMQGKMPEALRTRKDKIGFATPENQWIKAMESNFKELLHSSQDPFINIRALEKDFSTHVANSQDLRINRLWRILNFLSWKKGFRMDY